MASPYALLAGLALLREKKRLSQQRHELELQEWSGFKVRIGALTCLIPCEQVEEVMLPNAVSIARHVPTWVIGVAYFRAQLLTLVDMANLFDEGKTPEASARVFVIRGKQEWFGLKVTAFDGVHHIWSDTQEASMPAHFTATWLQYVRQWLALDGETVAVIDVQKLISKLETGGVRT